MIVLRSLAAGLAAGLLSSLAFDPVSLPLAMVAGLAILFAVVRRLETASRWLVALVGLSYGLAFMGPLIWWMRAVSSGAYVALVIAQAVVFVVIVLALRSVARLPGWPLWLAAVWVAGEWIRGSFPFTGFPWGRLAHTAIDTPFAPWVRLVGLPGTTFLLAVIAALLVAVAGSVAIRQRAAGVGVVVGLALIGLTLPTGVASPGETRQVAVVQGDVPGVFLSWPRGEIFELHADATQLLADRIASGESPRPDFVLWPENATDIDPYHHRPTRERIEELSAAVGAPILVGGIFDGPTVDTAYNAGVVWDADGPGERYVKRKPVPYGEYVPFRDSLGGLVPRIDRDIPRDMLAGDEPGALTIGDTEIGDTICYDIAYDDVVRGAVADGAQILVVQTSNAAFTGTAQPEQQWDISRLRALETGRYVLVPSTNGISGVVDADGRTVERAPQNEPAVIDIEVPLADGSTPAMRWGGHLELLLVVAGVGGVAAAVWAGRRTREPDSA